jgi:hypothetical protein
VSHDAFVDGNSSTPGLRLPHGAVDREVLDNDLSRSLDVVVDEANVSSVDELGALPQTDHR